MLPWKCLINWRQCNLSVIGWILHESTVWDKEVFCFESIRKMRVCSNIVYQGSDSMIGKVLIIELSRKRWILRGQNLLSFICIVLVIGNRRILDLSLRTPEGCWGLRSWVWELFVHGMHVRLMSITSTSKTAWCLSAVCI